MTEDAMQLLREWVDYYDGRGYSFRLSTRTRELIRRYDARYVPDDDETARMENNGEA